jgi:hypothetical protein
MADELTDAQIAPAVCTCRSAPIPEPLHGNIAIQDSKFSDLRPVTAPAVLPVKNQKNHSPRLQCYGVTAGNDRTERMVETRVICHRRGAGAGRLAKSGWPCGCEPNSP